MKQRISLLVCLAICVLPLAGCSCDHTWIEADCVTAKTCSVCHETEGEALGHTPGVWHETTDVITATVSRERHCTTCGEQVSAETVPLDTMARNGIFRFTPNEFMERLAGLANTYVEDFSYEFVSVPTGLMVRTYSSEGKMALIQFFRRDTTTLTEDEGDVAQVWCVSLIAVGTADLDLRYCFLMACDPALDMESAFRVDMELSNAFWNAAQTDGCGYYTYNELLYEHRYFPESYQNPAMNMVNIYASDFR